MDANRLRGEIVAKFRTQSAFAEAIGWQKNKVSRTLTGKHVLDVNEVQKIADVLDLDTQTFCDIFLPRKSPNGDNAA